MSAKPGYVEPPSQYRPLVGFFLFCFFCQCGGFICAYPPLWSANSATVVYFKEILSNLLIKSKFLWNHFIWPLCDFMNLCWPCIAISWLRFPGGVVYNTYYTYTRTHKHTLKPTLATWTSHKNRISSFTRQATHSEEYMLGIYVSANHGYVNTLYVFRLEFKCDVVVVRKI